MLFNKINEDLKAAMKDKDKTRLETLRMMKSKILFVNARGDLPEAEILKIVAKYAKSLKEEIDEARKVGRSETAEQAERELKIVEEYLPKQMSEAAVTQLIEQTIKELNASSIKDMGRVMKAVLVKAVGADGSLVSRLVKEKLQ